MGIQEGLPDRPLTLEELHELQAADQFDSVTSIDETPGEDRLFIRIGDVEHALHYTEDRGWHKARRRKIDDVDELLEDADES